MDASPDVTIVLGEDDDGHARLIVKNLERAGFEGKVIRHQDGQAVLDYFANRPTACNGRCLLILDINMPKVDGLGVLKKLRERYRMPVMMLTTSDDPDEIRRCYEHGCNLYITKPVVYEEFVEAMSRLGNFLKIARFPDDAGSQR